MSNELKITTSLVFSKDNALTKTRYSESIDVTGDAYTKGIQSIGTSEEEVVQGAEVGTPGYVILKNLDDTNYVEIGSTTGVYDIKLLAGEIACYRHNSATIYAKANTAACLLEYTVVEL